MRPFAVAFAVWLVLLQFLFRTDPKALVEPLAKGQLAAKRTELRAYNPEWELMGRLFAALAYANLAFEDRSYVEPLRQLADETDALERAHGPTSYLLPYGKHATQSLFVDGEIALMLAAKQLHAGGDASALKDRIGRIERQLESAPLLLAESYPDEGWVFCNTIAVAALKTSDAALGTDHSDLIARWLASLKTHFVDAKTGMLVSSFHADGRHRDGPEGSTLWLAAHMLQLVDEPFAREQYALARKHLGRGALGFGWAAEWPRQWRGGVDIDSGPTIPLLDANAGSSGTALLGAAAFGDEEWLRALVTSMRFAAFPTTDGHGGLHFAAGNSLADAVTLYALVQGPLWKCIQKGTACCAPRS